MNVNKLDERRGDFAKEKAEEEATQETRKIKDAQPPMPKSESLS